MKEPPNQTSKTHLAFQCGMQAYEAATSHETGLRDFKRALDMSLCDTEETINVQPGDPIVLPDGYAFAMSPGAMAVVEVDFRPIALLIRELRIKHDWSIGPCVGGCLMFLICTLQDIETPEDDEGLQSLKELCAYIAEQRSIELIQGN